ncbi:SHOCT domain-containing protein [Mycolicibacterium sp. XJ879]
MDDHTRVRRYAIYQRPNRPRHVRQYRKRLLLLSDRLAKCSHCAIADELKKLAELRDSGVLTDTEFQDLKARLLARQGANGTRTARRGSAPQPTDGTYVAVIVDDTRVGELRAPIPPGTSAEEIRRIHNRPTNGLTKPVWWPQSIELGWWPPAGRFSTAISSTIRLVLTSA